MNRVPVVGTGYMGTVTAVCLAWLGHEVVGIDVEMSRVQRLAAGQVPFVEPGLQELLGQAIASGRHTFTSDAQRKMIAEVATTASYPQSDAALRDLPQSIARAAASTCEAGVTG